MSEKYGVNAVVSEVDDFQRFKHIHWRAPIVMGVSFLGGVVLMALHHVLYQTIDGEPATAAAVQSWVIRAGTALAFISKLCLAIGTGVAYDQWMWVDLHSKPHEIGCLDSMFAILQNAFEFLKLRVWFNRPALVFLAAVTWLLPISSIFTPGTISIQSVPVTVNGTLQVPQRSYTTASDLYCGTSTDGNLTSYQSLATGLLNPTFATLLANSVLPVQASPTNLTYDLGFYGPAVSCQPSSDQDFQWAKKAISGYENMTNTRVFYFGWVPQSGWGPEVNGSFFASTDVQIGNFRIDFQSQDAARVFVYLNTTGVDAKGHRAPFVQAPAAQMMTCALYNASYAAHFDVESTGSQRVTAYQTFQNWMAASSTMNGTASDPLVTLQMNMQAVMEAFGMMIIGPITYSNVDQGPTLNSVYALSMNPAMFPSQPGLNQTEMTLRSMKLNEALFQNITLSMRYGVSSGIVFSDETAAAVVKADFEPQFVYQPRTLLIAYGINTLFAFICVMMGVHALLQNGASYTNSFSTIVRVTRDPSLSRLIADEGALQGAEPVPKHIRRAEVRLGRMAKTSISNSSSWL
ncbi:hypothetical protein A1O3_04091 [Capronia epimyces CBS 606.96]|uniref:Transmembrane protein n=1 Tax=Capronia epimyces CBS 606.96 TaxID=1182542 RepID=W9Y3P9_9EURO|nr:uncharacterized protein A1O3_04091 [Capronia epimyces CBS 606.96]EXJ87133.1 hypothetical protein A1O3_04091 [Capronia epimyces CBS 606.96]